MGAVGSERWGGSGGMDAVVCMRWDGSGRIGVMGAVG